MWDLCPDNRRLVDKQRLSQIIRKKRDDLFFLISSHLRDEPRFSWTIALTTATDALFVYHLLIEKDFSALSLIFLLIDEGIRFLTLQPLLPTIKTTFRTVPAMIPIRIKDYAFDDSDYYSYVQERARILSSPRGRAALLEGGLSVGLRKSTWAMIALPLDHLLRSPSIVKDFFLRIRVPCMGMIDLRTTRSPLYAVCTAATLVKKNLLYFYPFIIIDTVLQAMALRCRKFHGGRLLCIGITAAPMATIGGIGLSGMNFGTKNE